MGKGWGFTPSAPGMEVEGCGIAKSRRTALWMCSRNPGAVPRGKEVARFSPAGCRPCPRSEQRDIEEKGGVLGNPQSLHLLRSRVYQEIVEGVLTLASPGRESRVVLSEPSNPSGKLGSLSESIKIFW